MPRFQPDVLKKFAGDLLRKGGFSEEEARVTAESLVLANVCGYDSHGVMRIPQYVEFLAAGEVVTNAELTILSEGAVRFVADANRGVGQIQARRLLATLSQKAHAEGLAAGSLRHCGHIGRLGEYCEIAAIEGLVTMLAVNSHGGVVRVAPPGGTSPRISTNPIAVGVPQVDAAGKQTPLVLDFSTSATAEGKVRVKKIAGQSCPPGWLLDNQGKPTIDPGTLYGSPPGSILPFGGEQAYKGFGLGLMVELLCGALSGGASAREKPYPMKGNCVLMLVIDPSKFAGADFFTSEVNQLTQYVRSCPTVEGVAKITLPGDPERQRVEAIAESGIEVESGNWKALVDLASRLGVAVPS
jgi:uncharacterized oxidoreductase